METPTGGTGAGPDREGGPVLAGRHFLRDLEGLWGGVLKLAEVVEDMLTRSLRALSDGRIDLAIEVCGDEQAVDHWEVQVERECLRILALYQPVASDLRRVTAVLRISGDLERVGDLARHIARRVRKLARGPAVVPVPASLEALADEALGQMRDSLDALRHGDPQTARAVIAADARVDQRHRAVLKELKASIRAHPDHVDNWLRLINTARNLERIGDHATNIAEAVIYLKEGDIVRHVAPH